MKPFTQLFTAATLVALVSTPATGQWSGDSLSAPHSTFAAATVGELALFAGGAGADGFVVTDLVEAYDSSTDSWSTATLTEARGAMGVAVVGDLVLFAGGGDPGGGMSDVVDIYDASLGPPSDPAAWSTAALSLARVFPAGTSVGNKAFFAGGETLDLLLGPIATDVIDVYDAALGPPSDPGAWSVETLSVARTGVGATAAGNQALFAGGRDGSTPFDIVDIYDDDTGTWTTAQLSIARPLSYGTAASVGSHAFFAGAQFSGSPPFSWGNVVDIYDAQTKTWSTQTMSVARGEVSLTAVGNTMLFAGGATGASYSPTDIVERYDVSTGQWGPIAHLSEARFYMAATTVGGKALFAGGAMNPSSSVDTIDVFELAPWEDLGGSTAGDAGAPWLNGTGSLVGGSSASVALENAPSNALTLAWISFGPTPFAALGGTVHAFPFANQIGVFVDAEGSFQGTATWPVGIPAGTQVWFQFLVADASSIHGITLSNGLLATTP